MLLPVVEKVFCNVSNTSFGMFLSFFLLRSNFSKAASSWLTFQLRFHQHKWHENFGIIVFIFFLRNFKHFSCLDTNGFGG